MPAGVVSLDYFILGLLAQQPMSGYDIKRFLKGLNWLIGSPSGGSLYPILRTLLKKDLVTVEVMPGVDRPPRKIYSITEGGRQALQAWVEEPVATNAPLKAFAMRLLIADSHSHASLLAHLQLRQSQVAAQHASLTERARNQNLDEGLSLGKRLALSYGLAVAQAELDWLEGTLAWLSEEPPPEADRQGTRAASPD
jgi:DNA-binding PadR family transcriptional regulator